MKEATSDLLVYICLYHSLVISQRAFKKINLLPPMIAGQNCHALRSELLPGHDVLVDEHLQRQVSRVRLPL